MKYFRYVNSVLGLCFRLRDIALKLNLPFDMCRWIVAGEDVRSHPRGTGQGPPAFDQ